MSKVEELEHVIEQLPPSDFEKLSDWIARRRAALAKNLVAEGMAFRDHQAFLNSYSTEDEGLYDDAQGR